MELTLRTAQRPCKFFLYPITVSFVIALSRIYAAKAAASRTYFSTVLFYPKSVKTKIGADFLYGIQNIYWTVLEIFRAGRGPIKSRRSIYGNILSFRTAHAIL